MAQTGAPTIEHALALTMDPVKAKAVAEVLARSLAQAGFQKKPGAAVVQTVGLCRDDQIIPPSAAQTVTGPMPVEQPDAEVVRTVVHAVAEADDRSTVQPQSRVEVVRPVAQSASGPMERFIVQPQAEVVQPILHTVAESSVRSSVQPQSQAEVVQYVMHAVAEASVQPRVEVVHM
jgi:hypothetical protein